MVSSSSTTSSLSPGRSSGTGDVQGVLGTAVPVAAQAEAVDPGDALAPGIGARGSGRRVRRPRRSFARRSGRRPRAAPAGPDGPQRSGRRRGPRRRLPAGERCRRRAGPPEQALGFADARAVVDPALVLDDELEAAPAVRQRQARGRAFSRSRTPTGGAVEKDQGPVADLADWSSAGPSSGDLGAVEREAACAQLVQRRQRRRARPGAPAGRHGQQPDRLAEVTR